MNAFASRSDWPKGESPPLRCLCTPTRAPRIPPTLSSYLHPFHATPRVSIFFPLSLLSSLSVFLSYLPFPFPFYVRCPGNVVALMIIRARNTPTHTHASYTKSQVKTCLHLYTCTTSVFATDLSPSSPGITLPFSLPLHQNWSVLAQDTGDVTTALKL